MRDGFLRQYTSWRLQAGLLSANSDILHAGPCLDLISRTARYLERWTEYHNHCTMSVLADRQRIGLLSGQGHSSRRMSIAEFVCDAIVSHLDSVITVSRQSEPVDGGPVSHFAVSEVGYFTACVVGDIHCVRHFQTRMSSELSDTRLSMILCSGLNLALRKGSKEVVTHLLATKAWSEVDALTPGFEAAVQSGKIGILDLVMSVDSRSRCTQESFGQGLVLAARSQDRTQGLLMAKYLSSQRAPLVLDTDMPCIRRHMLYAYCESNDMKMATWILGGGTADMFGKACVKLCFNHPINAAVRFERTDILALLLSTRSEDDDKDASTKVISTAFKLARSLNFLDGALELLPHVMWLTRKEKMETMAEVEGGVEAVNKMYGAYKLQESINAEKGVLAPVGERALRKAVQNTRVANVKWLVARGVTLGQGFRVLRERYHESLSAFLEIDELLRQHGSPSIEVQGWRAVFA